MIALARAIAVAALAGMASIVPACSHGPAADAAVKVECTIRPQPPQVGPATVDLVLADATGAPVKGAQVRVEGNMNHAGMVPSIADARETGPGRYEAELEFTMGGDWFLLVQATLADGSKIERTIPVPAVRKK